MSAPDKKPLRAYTVRDGDDGATIVFERSSVAARREGANDLNCGFEDVESCKRSPEFDQYAPGPVPPQAQIESGWWFECMECTTYVDDMTEEPVYLGQFVFCCKECHAYYERNKRDAADFEDAACELLEARYPGAKLQYVSRVKNDRRVPMRLIFTFPGGKYSVEWISGDSTAAVYPDDVEAFVSLYRKSKS
ncbi:hypothetical protein [Burkholderia ubonensis]|uniref:Uncharacterized protein n=1 Tax=Burkholderia ubonensis TaxID=101571 RepID=A0ABD4DZL9_9BURK|nr:hypothetical protein [Burkholderia ubonensis]KVN83428.1 hypothetical protein WJ68_16060 [Burkholderia ubonensis]